MITYSRIVNKIQFELTRLHITLARAVLAVFSRVPGFFHSGPRKDVLMLPYLPQGNVGSRIRFEIYLRYFEADGLTYDLDYIGQQEELYEAFLSPNHESKVRERFQLIRRFLWSRVRVALKASRYRAIYIQRDAFPFCPSGKSAFVLESMARLNPNITLDFYDADYQRNAELVYSSVKSAAKLTVVNDFLEEHFRPYHDNITIFPNALESACYVVKQDYAISGSIRLFWTGTYGHLRNFEACLEALYKLEPEFDFTLVLVTDGEVPYQGLKIEHHPYDLTTFYDIMASCDIALFPVAQGDDIHRGAMAMKTLEYMACGLPTVGAPWGLSAYLEDERSILIAQNTEQWVKALRRCFGDQALREQLGRGGRDVFMAHHDAEVSYSLLKSVLFAEPCAPALETGNLSRNGS